MDPQQSAAYATAHGELQDLFREIARHGRVTAHELQHALLPLTAGDARRDLGELIDELKHRQLALDEAEFIRLLWRKMYLSNVTFTTRQRSVGAPRGREAASAAINIPLAHVIVSIKRRAQLKQFAHYYASRGISGADHLHAPDEGGESATRAPRHLLQAQRRRQAAATAAAQVATINALRERAPEMVDVVACAYDSEAMRLRAHVLWRRLRAARAVNCSRLHCMVLTKDPGGNLLLSARHFLDQTRRQLDRYLQRTTGPDECTDNNDPKGDDDDDDDPRRRDPTAPWSNLPVVPTDSDASDVIVHRLEDLGLRNTVAIGVGRGLVTVATERRVHSWHDGPSTTAIADDVTASPSLMPPSYATATELLEDAGDAFGLIGGPPLVQRPKTVHELAGISQLACGDGLVVGLADEGRELYTWGGPHLLPVQSPSASGSRHLVGPVRLPFELPHGQRIHRLACGRDHALAATIAGTVLAWGSNVHGQLGLAGNTGLDDLRLGPPVTTPTVVALPRLVQALDVACGDYHSLALTDTGGLVGWGNNWAGQLAVDPKVLEDTAAAGGGCLLGPTRLSWWAATAPSCSSSSSPTPRVYLLAAMGDTTAVVTEHGQVFVWGKCIPSGAIDGPCGVVSRWRPQLVEPLEHCRCSEPPPPEGVDGLTEPATVSVVDGQGEQDQRGSPWTSLALANGLIVVTRASAAASSDEC